MDVLVNGFTFNYSKKIELTKSFFSQNANLGKNLDINEMKMEIYQIFWTILAAAIW